MNLEILFRGKRLDNGQWVHGYYIYKQDPLLPGIDAYFIVTLDENSMSVWNKVDPATVGQYTGLTDRSGKRIFDGDILKSDDELFVVKYGHCGGVKNVKHEVGYVGFYVNPCGKDAEKLLSYGMRTDILYWMNEYGAEIIGNVRDRPELLEGETKNGEN